MIGRSMIEYRDFLGGFAFFATVASGRLGKSSYRYRAEWVMSENARRGIAREIRLAQPDVIHCHTQAHALRCHEIARKIPLVVTMDTTSCLLADLPAYASQRSALTPG